MVFSVCSVSEQGQAQITSWVEGTAHGPPIAIMRHNTFLELFQNYEMQVTIDICLEN